MADWRDTTGLADGTDVAKIYVDESIKAEWQQEAEQNGQSLSQYLFYLVQEARLVREDDLMFIGGSPLDDDGGEESVPIERMDALEQRITELENHVFR